DPDSALTEAQLISVRTIPVDTTKAIKDIKPPLDVPFTFREALPYIISAIILAILVIVIVRLLRKKKKSPVEIKVKVPTRRPHEIAMEALKQTEAEKLWQQGFFKRYNSNVSEIIRTYIEYRFGIYAFE